MINELHYLNVIYFVDTACLYMKFNVINEFSGKRFYLNGKYLIQNIIKELLFTLQYDLIKTFFKEAILNY